MVLMLSTLMVKEVANPLSSFVTWLTRMELAWQSSVTTVKIEYWLMGLICKEVMCGLFSTLEQVSRMLQNWPSLQRPLPTASSLSNTNALLLFFSTMAMLMAGGCHVILRRWRTGVDAHLLIPTSAHAEWLTHAQSPATDATATKMIMCGAKTAACLQRSPNCLFCS